MAEAAAWFVPLFPAIALVAFTIKGLIDEYKERKERRK